MGNRGRDAMVRRLIFSAMVTASLMAAEGAKSAMAQSEQWRASDSETVYQPGMIDNKGQLVRQSPHDKDSAGASLQAGGGLTSFVSPDSRANTGLGGYWAVRGVYGIRTVLAAEAAYVGTAHALNSNAMQGGTHMLSNGVEGALRLNLPIVSGPTTIAPFVLGGIGWANYRIVDQDLNLLPGRSSDNVITWPVGAGFAFSHEHFVFDARVSWRFVRENALWSSSERQAMALDSWSAGAQVGYVF